MAEGGCLAGAALAPGREPLERRESARIMTTGEPLVRGP